jgi:hypothetical protein
MKPRPWVQRRGVLAYSSAVLGRVLRPSCIDARATLRCAVGVSEFALRIERYA